MGDQAEKLRAMAKDQQTQAVLRKRRLSRIIVIASGKGGVGKTNLVVNLAIALGQLGKKAIVLDTDLGMANADILMDLKPTYTLVDVIRGDKELEDIILKGPYNVDVIPGGSGLSDMISLDSQQREQLISRLSYLEEAGNVVLVDCPAGLTRDVLSFIAVADDLLLLTTPEPTAITDVYGMIKVVDSYQLHSSIKLAINMVRNQREGENVFRRINYVCQHFLTTEVDFLGSIEYDQNVRKAVLTCSPYVLQFPRSRATQGTQQIARRISQEDDLYRGDETGKGFLNRLLNFWS